MFKPHTNNVGIFNIVELVQPVSNANGSFTKGHLFIVREVFRSGNEVGLTDTDGNGLKCKTEFVKKVYR